MKGPHKAGPVSLWPIPNYDWVVVAYEKKFSIFSICSGFFSIENTGFKGGGFSIDFISEPACNL